MKLLNGRYEQAQLEPNAAHLPMRLMCAGHEKEIELVRNELFKAGIPSETRRHPIAEALGVGGLELWVQNEQDFFKASRVYNRLHGKADNMPETPAPSPKAETSGGFGSGPKLQAAQSGTPKDVNKVESRPVAQPHCLELKEASSLLQKGIEDMLLRESELAGECTSLHGKVKELTQVLAQARADVAREIKSRE